MMLPEYLTQRRVSLDETFVLILHAGAGRGFMILSKAVFWIGCMLEKQVE